MPLQRVTSLRRRAKANAPAPSYWLRRVVVAEIRRVHRAGGGGAERAIMLESTCNCYMFGRIARMHGVCAAYCYRRSGAVCASVYLSLC